MDSVKNYPWSENLEVSQEDFKKWQSDDTEDSFVFWSLKNKVINRNQYFNWAVEYYNTPFLEDMFFEQHLITKKQWNTMKDLTHWTKEMMPVAVWDNIVFIGCLEPPKGELFDFEHRFVLVSSMALQMTWKFTKGLSKVIKEEITRSQVMKTDSGVRKTDDFVTESSTHSVTHVTSSSVANTKIKALQGKNKSSQNQTVTPEIPSEEKHPFDTPLVNQTSQQNESKEKTASNLIKVSSHIKAKASLPEVEEERNVDLDNNTFPGRHYEDDNLIMGNFAQNSSDKQMESTQNLQTEDTSTNTFYLQIKQNEDYENLWKQTKFVFCTSMVLKVKADKVFLLTWSGRMKINKTEEELADLNEYSLFKVVQRGHAYHGFVVETSANKKFFNKIGWNNYPKHVTAIPVKNEKQELKLVFVGLSTGSLFKDKVKIKNIEKIVSDFFQSNSQKLFLAA